MTRLHIEGGTPLRGTVHVRGAKNAALPACIAALLTEEPVVLRSVPQLLDVSTILYTLSSLGKRVVRNEESVSIASDGTLFCEANPYSVRQMRASFLVLGPLVARLGRAVVPLPGGCAIGTRPVDLHLMGLRALGAHIEQQDGVVQVTADRLKGGRVRLPFPSVGATEQVLMAACLADGRTVIERASIEPEVLDLVELLRSMGAQVCFQDRTLVVDGVRKLHGADHTLIPDRIEAGTFLLAGLITRGQVTVSPVRAEEMSTFLGVLGRAGARVEVNGEAIMAACASRLCPVDLETSPHPGFPTDLHPQTAACLTIAQGDSTVRETVFERRFAYAEGLRAMGGDLLESGRTLSIAGVDQLIGARVEAPDIRGGAALVLAGLAARGETVVGGVEHIDRGHERLVEKLQGVGAHIERREDDSG
jgi:UDP-N-acetylglucosamine 1-carboxyvinyltransferase